MEDVIDTHYPKKPDNLDDLCLHDFVANYDWYTKDRRGKRVYRKLTKPRLINRSTERTPEGRILLLSTASVCALQERSLFAQRKRDCRGSIQSSLACQ